MENFKPIVGESQAQALLDAGMPADQFTVAPKPEKIKIPKPRVAPNRRDQRRARKTKSSWAQRPFARPIPHGPQPPASFETLVTIHVKDAEGRTIRKFTVPRSSVDPAMLAKRRSEA
jgi:hypothetical protein